MKQAVQLGPRGVRAVVALARYVVAHGSTSRDAQLLGLALLGLSDVPVPRESTASANAYVSEAVKALGLKEV